MSAIQFEETSRIPDVLRRSYLASLQESQEFYVERLVETGRCVLLCHSARAVGYAVIHETTLVEFFVFDAEVSLLLEIIEVLVTNYSVTKSLCKSFDHLMLNAVASKPARTEIVGWLFRESRDVEPIRRLGITARRATRHDLVIVQAIHDGFFDSIAEVVGYIEGGGMFIYEWCNSQAVGCGIFKRILPDQNFVDIGMVVAAAYRRRGIGAYIASHLKVHCLSEGYQPVCGCGVENIASLRSLERAGFLCTHSLIEFAY